MYLFTEREGERANAKAFLTITPEAADGPRYKGYHALNRIRPPTPFPREMKRLVALAPLPFLLLPAHCHLGPLLEQEFRRLQLNQARRGIL